MSTRDRAIHLQPGPFPAQVAVLDGCMPAEHTVQPGALTQYWRPGSLLCADLVQQFTADTLMLPVIPAVDFLVTGIAPAFLPSIQAGVMLWMVKERRVCMVNRPWRQSDGLLGTITIFFSERFAEWYCDPNGRGFDGSQLLLPVLMLIPAEPA